MNYTKSEYVRDIAENLIENLDDPYMKQIKAAAPAIAYREGDGKKKSNGMVVHADCEKVKTSNKQYMAYDYIITVYSKNCEYMTEEQFELLLYHELLHIDCVRTEDGELHCKIRQHDVQDFKEITYRFGEDWSTEGLAVKNIWDVIGGAEDADDKD